MAGTKASLGSVYTKIKKYKEAKIYLESSYSISRAIQNREVASEASLRLSQLDSCLGNWKDAYTFHKEHIKYKDSIYNEENLRKSVSLQMNYEFEKKEAESKLQQQKKELIFLEEKQKQRTIIIFTSLGLGMLLILTVVILRSLAKSKRDNKIIQSQKREVEEQKLLVEDKQKEILDSIYYAKRIQNSLLPTDKYIERNLKKF